MKRNPLVDFNNFSKTKLKKQELKKEKSLFLKKNHLKQN